MIERTMRAFMMLYDTRGWFQEGLDHLGPAAIALETASRQSTSGRTEQVAFAHLLVCQALLTFRLAQHEQAQAMLERSLEILRPMDEPGVLVEAITFLGFIMEAIGNDATAVELYSEGQKIAKAIGDRWFAALCFICLADQVGIVQGIVKPEDIYEQMQSAVAEWRVIGDLQRAELEARLTGRQIEAAHEQARHKTLEAAAGEVLRQVEPTPGKHRLND